MKNEVCIQRAGMSLIELLVSVALLVIIFGGAYLSYSSILDTLTNSELRTAAVAVLNRQIEIIRNLPYDSVGTQGGLPNGILQRQTTVMQGKIPFLVVTIIHNIDDPFDSVAGGTPRDTTPADYKQVDIEVSCLLCKHFVPISITTTVAPKNLESAGQTGSLFVYVLDSNSDPVPGALVTVVNGSVSPTVNLTDTTNDNGVLQLVGAPTSTTSYQISATLPGFSTDRTYPIGAFAPSTTYLPHATVSTGYLTEVTLFIDNWSNVNVYTTNATCAPVTNVPFSMTGTTKFLATGPSVPKFATSSVTDASGQKFFTNVEWDAYAFSYNKPGYDLAGTWPFLPLNLLASTTALMRFDFEPAQPDALVVRVMRNGASVPIQGAYVTLSKSGGFSQTLVTGHSNLTQTNWSGANFFGQSGGIDTDSVPGTIKLALQNGKYPTTTQEWLISNTFDTGSASTTYYTLNWTPTGQLPQTGAGSLEFQIASNNDGTTWNFVGPDGTPGTFYTTTGATIPVVLSGSRYLRYKVYLKTADELSTPSLDSVSVDFNGMCVPQSSVYFPGLTPGTYDLRVAASGFVDATSTVSISTAWKQVDAVLLSQ